MIIIRARNVCQTLPQTISYLLDCGRAEESRAGPVLVAAEPMVIVTEHPEERVLFSKFRDANPFFHIAEAVWMLGGGKDARFLDRFIHDFSKRYAEEDGRLHDAYGWRWRHAFGVDQLQEVIDMLEQSPLDRQCVIQMWDTTEYHDDLIGKWKSRPCNTNLFVRVNAGKLDLTACCRSNDMLWGAHGANAVHFSVLQEYLAASLRLPLGTMYQLSNNAHVYQEVLEKMNSNKNFPISSYEALLDDRYAKQTSAVPMFETPKSVYADIDLFIQAMEENDLEKDYYINPWFWNTLLPMMKAHTCFKKKDYEGAIVFAQEIHASDWRLASIEWLERRIKK